MVKFMDRFSLFYLKWVFNPLWAFSVLMFIIALSCVYDSVDPFLLFGSGFVLCSELRDHCHRMWPDLEYLEDESDGK